MNELISNIAILTSIIGIGISCFGLGYSKGYQKNQKNVDNALNLARKLLKILKRLKGAKFKNESNG